MTSHLIRKHVGVTLLTYKYIQVSTAISGETYELRDPDHY